MTLLVVNETGNLVLTSQNKSVVWSANLSKEVRTPVIFQLLDSGNLVLRGERDGGSETYLWQSFDYPSDTLLPGMKLGWDLKTGLERRITSWKSSDDPSPGDFTWALERQDNPESIFWKGSRKLTRSGPWNGLRFSASSLRQNPVFNFSFVSNEDELYYTFDLIDKAVFSRMVMNQTLYLRQRFIWNKATKSWDLNSNVPRDLCDTYALCGAYGICIISDMPVCQCLKGFKPKSRGYVDWSQGCVRDKSLNYSRQDGFIKFTAMKLPDATLSWVSKSMNLNECREKCLDNSSCMAYTNSDIRGEGSGCAMWFGELIDMRDFPDGGQDLYIRMSASEIGAKGEPRTKIVVIVISTAALSAVVIAGGYLVHKRRRNILLFFLSESSFASDTITSSQSLSDGRTLVSKDGSFELGFFSPGSSKNRYVGIWYKNMPVKTVVWVANRINPINDSSGVLVVNKTGNLVLTSQNKSVVWSANLSKEVRTPVVLQLLDSGNLVLRGERDGDSETYLWQSFDYPSDTLLPGMKLGWDFKTGLERRITSWKSSDDPSPGDFIWKIERQFYPELVMWKGSRKFYRTGPWNGLIFSASSLRLNPIFKYRFVFNEDELYYTFYLTDKAVISRTVMNQTVSLRQRFIWRKANQSWELYSNLPKDQCDTYGLCGAYGICIISQSPICQCLEGFHPKSGGYVDWSQGCVHNKPLNYSRKDGFIKFSELKLPDSTSSWVSKSMNLKECREKCLENSSCMAYTNSDITRGGSGCVMWFGDLIDMRNFQDGGQDLYIRMSASELGGNNRRTDQENEDQNEDLELPLFELATIANATDNFSINKKLGEGGFGPVYKGTLADGQEIAHRNLVKLLGCCIQGEEKLLIYEFMPNRSLDSFIFDQTKRKLLDWSKRFCIICGTARGLLYLHHDSRLRIIHRDLKASNVLLDHEMNPKISDFGLARTFVGDEIEGSTKRVVGTYGYMAPEYASDGLFSVKSDVFSFGILLLEIVSGKKNRGFYHSDKNLNLIGHAWKLWNNGMPSQLIDAYYQESCNLAEVIRCIHVGLLCVQHHPEDRPCMPSVILMLGSEIMLPQPKQPGFLADRKSTGPNSSSSMLESSSTNTITISTLEGR
ncbi:hypothetical protein CUMW_146300 [Citrus unshiu]|nr:hypothetical protein CUMW_146300 [Citrus unshiu]